MPALPDPPPATTEVQVAAANQFFLENREIESVNDSGGYDLNEVGEPIYADAVLTNVAGWYYHDAKGFEREYVHLVRDPENPHDTNAIAVLSSAGKRIGFLLRKLAARFAPAVDSGQIFLAGRLVSPEQLGPAPGQFVARPPLVVERDKEAGTTRIEMAPEVCAGPFRNACPIHKTRDGRYTFEFTDKAHRLAGRRREQETPVFRERYARRSGIESTNSGLKNRLGLKRLRVRGRGSMFRVILHKVAGWNVLRAAASQKMRAWVRSQVAQTLKGEESGPNERLCALVLRR